MGKIQTPTPAPTPTKTSSGSSSTETISVSDQAIENVATDNRDELNLTNEALRLLSVKQMLGVKSSDYDNQVKEILQMAKDRGVKNKNMLSAMIREIGYKLGASDSGDERINKIHRYLKIDQSIKGLVNKQEQLYENRN